MNKDSGNIKAKIIALSIVFILGVASLFLDKQISTLFYNLHNPFFNWLFGLSIYFQIPGILFGLVILTLAVIFFLKKDKIRWIFRIISSFLITSIVAFILKEIISRPRPYIVLGLEKPLLDVLGSSFPSAHAATVFAMLPFFEREYPRIKYLWIIFSVLVCFIRIYFPVHYLSDILFGSLIGYLIGYVICNYSFRHHLKKHKKKLFKK